MEYRRGRISQEYGWASTGTDNLEPFVWTKLADEILDKVVRGQATLDWNPRRATS